MKATKSVAGVGIACLVLLIFSVKHKASVVSPAPPFLTTHAANANSHNLSLSQATSKSAPSPQSHRELLEQVTHTASARPGSDLTNWDWRNPAASAEGAPSKISDSFMSYRLSGPALAALRNRFKEAGHPLPDDEDVNVVVPADPQEPTVPFRQLASNCPALSQFQFPVYLRITGTGDVQDAVTPIDGQSVPRAVFDCHFQNGPDTAFNTEYSPNRAPAAQTPQ